MRSSATARQMLEAALKAEVVAYIEQFADHVGDNGRRLVVRNGYHQPRDVLTAAGAVTVVAPRVNDKRVTPIPVIGNDFARRSCPRGRTRR